MDIICMLERGVGKCQYSIIIFKSTEWTGFAEQMMGFKVWRSKEWWW